ncbi:hypothetical protein LF817_05485 [Halobacillus sp. A1]|uniref:hypothetical protein n=1 Tax=Halobacillus sp. A1 TaxID=2880262 RepID=UPI0020A67D44|nr:hypothetical protein [Halobacillus sp. A1]MCP3030789.1 hypothetical protein [Halobacillus sp. A1]
MKQIFAFENKKDYEKNQATVENFYEKLKNYQIFLEVKYALKNKPKAIVWTSQELATTVFSQIPIPAFTNKNLIYFSPELTQWRKLFLQQLEGHLHTKIESFYENLSENHILSILGHELTHHSDLFVDEFDEERVDSIWFEEGMCDYISRKNILDEKEYSEITNVETELVEIFKHKYGAHSLDEFGQESYQSNLTSIMFDYWRSFLAVKHLVEVRANNDIMEIFNQYHQWHREGRKVPLMDHFKMTNFFT